MRNWEACGPFRPASPADSEGKRREFACRLVGVSAQEMVMIVPVTGRPGSVVVVECEEFGQWEGVVNHSTNKGFAMAIDATEDVANIMENIVIKNR